MSNKVLTFTVLNIFKKILIQLGMTDAIINNGLYPYLSRLITANSNDHHMSSLDFMRATVLLMLLS